MSDDADIFKDFEQTRHGVYALSAIKKSHARIIEHEKKRIANDVLASVEKFMSRLPRSNEMVQTFKTMHKPYAIAAFCVAQDDLRGGASKHTADALALLVLNAMAFMCADDVRAERIAAWFPTRESQLRLYCLRLLLTKAKAVHCSGCGAEKAGALKTCSGCRVACYCNVQCQTAHWEAHKAACKTSLQPCLAAIANASSA